MPVEDLNALRQRLAQSNAKWTAATTTVHNLTDEEKRARLGCIVDPAVVRAAMAPRVGAPVAGFAPEVDWRNRNGNHVPAVEDQGFCGSCVSFCSCALVSSMSSIEHGQLIDLSEADLHFCSSHGPSCAGWSADAALGVLKNRGVIEESAFPYMSAFASPPQIDPETHLWLPHCNAVPNHDAIAVKINNSGTIGNIVDRKNYLTNTGPCSSVLHVFNDFYSYSSGVYHHVSGPDMGLHCVEVIGYSEAEQCWICKNSWGAGWGMNGFFKIAYGEAGIDTEFPFWTASGVRLPVRPASWSSWENLGGIITSGPAAASWSANRLDCFARGQNNHMWHKWWDGTRWSGWEDLGGLIDSAPAAVSWGPNRIDCFARGMDNHMWHKWWDGSRWHDWENLGGLITSRPAAASWAANRLDCFAKGTDNHMWHLWWDGNRWNGWEDLGGIIDDGPAAVSWGANRIDCFARGMNNHMFHKWWDGSHWSGWEDLGGIITSGPTVSSWAANRLDCFAKGQDNHMWHKWWDGARWNGWEDLGGVIDWAPAAVSWGPNRIDCFAAGMDNEMWHKWWG